MTSSIVLPVPDLRAERLLDQDRLATVWLVAAPDGRAGVLTVGHRVLVADGDRTAFLTWLAALRRVSASPGIAAVLAGGLTADGRPYLAAATAATTLGDRLGTGPLPASRVRDHGRAVAAGLARVHQAGTAHGAVRPSTVLLDGDEALLAGFGLTAPGLGEAFAVDAYTPPEHVDDAIAGRVAAGPAGDVYDLAATLYVALGGTLPWTDAPRDPTLRAAAVAGLPHAPEQLLGVLRVCLSPNPAERPTALVLAQLLATVPAGDGPVPGAVDQRLLSSPGVRRVALGIAENVATGFSGAVGGAVGGAVAARMFAPPTAPPPAAPPSPAPAMTPSAHRLNDPGASTAGPASHAVTSIIVKVVAAVIVAMVVGGVVAYHTVRTKSSGTASAGGSGPLAADPRTVDFGPVAVGGQPAKTVTVRNTTARDIVVGNVTTTGDGFAVQSDGCSRSTLAAGASCPIAVTFRPALARAYTGAVQIGSNGLRVPLTGHGQVVDLAGRYDLRRRSIEPDSAPSEMVGFWLAGEMLGERLASDGLTIDGGPTTYTALHMSLTAVGDGTFQGTSRGTVAVVRPENITDGRVATLTYTLTVPHPDDNGFRVVLTFDGTRR